MKDLKDYSGPFSPDVQLEDFSKDALVKLVAAGGRIWGEAVLLGREICKEKHGDEEAAYFYKELMHRLSAKRVNFIKEAMNIKGDDVETFFKFMQLEPAVKAYHVMEYELKNKDDGIFTCVTCKGLEEIEDKGDVELIKQMCGNEPSTSYKSINPKMESIPIKMPPRKSKDEIACIRRYVVKR